MDLLSLQLAKQQIHNSILSLSKPIEEGMTNYTGPLEMGAWNSSGIKITVNSWARSTQDKFVMNVSKQILIDPGWRVMLIEFNESGGLVTRKTYTESFTYTKRVATTYFCVGKQDDSTITAGEAEKRVRIADVSTYYKSKLFEKKWLIIGDSITDISYLPGIKKYYQYIQEETGIVTLPYGGAGSGFTRDMPVHNANDIVNEGVFKDRIEELPNTCDILTVFGGTNDWGCNNCSTYQLGELSDTSLTTVTGNIRACFDNIVAKYGGGDTLITVFTPLPREECYPGNDVTGASISKWSNYTLGDLSDRIMELCEDYNFHGFDLYHTSRCYLRNDTYKTNNFYDTVHYNSYGHEDFAKDIKGFLESLF